MNGDSTFRDLNKNGRLDPYEDPRLPVDERVEDLLGQMTLEEKVGLMFHPPIGIGPDGTLEEGGQWHTPTSEILGRHINTVNIYAAPEPRLLAEWYNRLQQRAEESRLGIPVTVSTDPRHAFSHNPAASMAAGYFSQWPETTGLAATRDEDLVRRFGDIARQEYIATGLRVALHPMADLATEPRWARGNGTFGEDAELSSRMTRAYIEGFQGESLGPESVACMTKHFPGAGPQKDGEDAHFPYGREQVYPGNNFDYHLIPFEAAFQAGTAQIMPYYGMPVGLPIEEVGFGYNRDVITGLLRGRYGFDGVVCTDWGLVTTTGSGEHIYEAKAWGVEHLSREERVLKIVEAGCDQLGGELCTDILIGLVRDSKITEERIDQSARRILRDKFRLGLFDNPYVDPEAAERICGNAEFRAAGEEAQRRSIVLLRNARAADRTMLPLGGRPRLYLENVDPETARRYAEVVVDPRDADVALLRLQAPYEPRNRTSLERHFHAGSLAFPEEELTRIRGVLEAVPTIVDVYLDRPAILTEIAREAAALLGNFGASDAAVLDVVFGRHAPSGKLPFEMPSSMDAVRRQREDVPFDSPDPLFPFGWGLTY